MNSEFFNYSLRLKDVVCALTLFAQEPLSISLRATRLSDYESAGVHTFTCASVLLCRCDVLHMEVKTLDVGGSFRYVVGSLLFVVLCCEQREFGVAGRAALVVEDGQDLTACYAIEPASVNISGCYRLWHVCLLYWQSAVSGQ